MIKEILLVGLGGGIGSILRFLISRMSIKWSVGHFPVGTFFVNLLGCFLIGILIGLSFKNNLNNNLRDFLIVGFCGGYTTFSTFSLENYLLFQEGNYGTLIVYILTSILLGFSAVWAGLLLTR
ncbi:MAG: fluoride efflux transporter CrcB [Dysgonamonadaceae bacterium]|jgi:CrcB protein|nr:fluoride efflux transporter CrcB [Dysgonamonadaceae bacterium]